MSPGAGLGTVPRLAHAASERASMDARRSTADDAARPLGSNSLHSVGSDDSRSVASVTFVGGVPVVPKGSRQRLSFANSIVAEPRRSDIVPGSEEDDNGDDGRGIAIATTRADSGISLGRAGNGNDDEETRQLRELLISSGVGK